MGSKVFKTLLRDLVRQVYRCDRNHFLFRIEKAVVLHLLNVIIQRITCFPHKKAMLINLELLDGKPATNKTPFLNVVCKLKCEHNKIAFNLIATQLKKLLPHILSLLSKSEPERDKKLDSLYWTTGKELVSLIVLKQNKMVTLRLRMISRLNEAHIR